MNNEMLKLMPSDEPLVERLQQWNKDQHLIFVRYYIDTDEPTYRGIANDLNIPVGTVRSRLHRARQRILQWRSEQQVTEAA